MVVSSMHALYFTFGTQHLEQWQDLNLATPDHARVAPGGNNLILRPHASSLTTNRQQSDPLTANSAKVEGGIRKKKIPDKSVINVIEYGPMKKGIETTLVDLLPATKGPCGNKSSMADVRRSGVSIQKPSSPLAPL
nr:hypothetical protein Itr_chr15CG09060 [Ipomoea trifida]